MEGVISATKQFNKFGIISNKYANKVNTRTTFTKLHTRHANPKTLKRFINGVVASLDWVFHCVGEFVNKHGYPRFRLW